MGPKKNPAKKSKGKSKPAAKSAKRSAAVKPIFPAAEIHYLLTKIKPKVDVKPEVSLYLSSAEEYLLTEMLEKAGNHAISRRSKTIEVQDIVEAIQADEELDTLLGDIIRDAQR